MPHQAILGRGFLHRRICVLASPCAADKKPDNDGLSCVPSPSNRARMQSTSSREARAAASDHTRALYHPRGQVVHRDRRRRSVTKSINQD
jgi:hypothetical protein